MWIGWLIVLLAGVADSSITGNQACHYLGSRFAHTVSSCSQSFCVDMGRRASGMFAPFGAEFPTVSCDAAVGYMLQILADVTPAVHGSGRDSAEEMLEFIDKSLLAELELLALGGDTSRGSFVESAGVFDAWTLQKAATDWESWSDIVVPRILASGQWLAMRNVYSALAGLLITSSWLYVEQRRALNAAIRFHFDFVALMGHHLLPHSLVKFMRGAVAHAHLEHRQSDSRDYRSRQQYGVPSCPHKVVELSRYIDDFARGVDVDTERLRRLMKGWSTRPNSAAQALIGDQIRSSLCRILPRVISQFQTHKHRLEHVTLGVTLIDICRPLLPKALLRIARNELASLYHSTRRGVVRDGRDVRFLYNDSLHWGMGLESEQASPAELSVSVASVLEDFLAHQTLPSSASGTRELVLGTDDLELARAFGRAVGLSILHAVELPPLGISASVARLLHPRDRINIRSMRSMHNRLDGLPINIFTAVSAGINESLGPGGVYMFSEDEWVRLFVSDAANDAVNSTNGVDRVVNGIAAHGIVLE